MVPLNAADIDTGTEDSTLLHKTGDDKPKKEKSKKTGAMPFDLLDLVINDTHAAKSIKKNVAKAPQTNDPIKQFIVQSQLHEQEIDCIGVTDESDLELKAFMDDDATIQKALKAEREDIEDLQEEQELLDGSKEPTIVEEDSVINKDISDPLDAKSVMEMLNGTGVSADGNGLVDDITKEYICTTKLLMRNLMR